MTTTFKYRGYTIKIKREEYIYESPRDWDNLGTMVYWHKKYILGDIHPKINPQRYLKELGEKVVILPLYIYDHSGITMNTTGFRCPWDSGQVGYIYVSYDDLRKEYGWKYITKKRIKQVEKYLSGEVETYDLYLRGEVYSYVVEDPQGEIIDAVGGYYEEFPDEDSYIASDAKHTIDWQIKKKQNEKWKKWASNEAQMLQALKV